jgi:DNA-binding transcriptional regulator YdaS (Cro superfamily)
MNAYEMLHAIYGTQEAIAKAMKVDRTTVVFWKKSGIPPKRAAQVEKVTKGKVTILDVIKG